MPRPTKFELMRANRDAADWRNRDRAPSRENVKAWVPPKQLAAVPTMQVDGVRYREVQDNWSDTGACAGCAFQNAPDGYQCLKVEPVAIEAFGGDCAERRVIYIRAEA